MSQRPIAIDLFAGAGGLSLGFEQAGFDLAAAVEMDPIHASVHAYNFPQCRMLVQSVASVSGAQLRAISGRDIDVVIGGAPCQGFSLMGQRALDDPRNQLVREFIRIVRELQPRYCVFENVKGLTIGTHKQFLAEIVTDLATAGYQLVLPWQVLNARQYGVPQSRERLFLIGVRQALPLPHYPEPFPTGVTCAEALADLPDAEQFAALLHQDAVEIELPSTMSDYARSLREDWHLGYRRRWQPQLLTSSIRTEHSALSRQRFLETLPGTIEPISRFFRLAPEGVARTLRAGTDSARGAFTSPRPIHYRYGRCVTVREMARLHGFPDWFRLHVTKWHGARQIGNSVPPPLARAIAQQIMACLPNRVSPPDLALDLGESKLLNFDMSQACHYWQVASPIAQRDRQRSPKQPRLTRR